MREMLRLPVLGGECGEAIPPSSVRPEGPARPHGTWHPSPGALCSQTLPRWLTRMAPVPSPSCCSSREGLPVQPANTSRLAQGQGVLGIFVLHEGEQPELSVGSSSPAGDRPFIPGVTARGFLASCL